MENEINQIDIRSKEQVKICEQSFKESMLTADLKTPIPGLSTHPGYQCLYDTCVFFTTSKKWIEKHTGDHLKNLRQGATGQGYKAVTVQIGYKQKAFGVSSSNTQFVPDTVDVERARRHLEENMKEVERIQDENRGRVRVLTNARETTGYYLYRNWDDFIVTGERR